MGELADKKMLIQSKGVRIGWELEKELSEKYVGAVNDYMSFFMSDVPVGVLNGFYSDSSPFEIKSNGDGYAVFNGDVLFHEIDFLDRPSFYDKTTSKGTNMGRLCKMVVPGFPIIYMNRGCMYLGAEQCMFCVVGHIDTDPYKDPDEVAEAVSEGVKEGAIQSHVALTSGALPDDRGVRLLGDTVKAIRDIVDIPISVNGEPPRQMKHLDLIMDADSVYFNLEVYDKSKRRLYLPGKSEFTVEYYDKVFEECLDRFDENQVASVLLAGLEDDRSYLEGIEHLASMGVVPVPVPFYPTFHSKLSGTPPPSAGRMRQLYLSCAEIMDRYGLDPIKTRAGFMKGGAIFALKEVLEGV